MTVYWFMPTDAITGVTVIGRSMIVIGTTWPTAILNPAGAATDAVFCPVIQVRRVVTSAGAIVIVVVVVAAAPPPAGGAAGAAATACEAGIAAARIAARVAAT